MKRLSEHENVEINDSVFTMDDLLSLYRLQEQLLSRDGVVASLEECIAIWTGYSDDYSASWLDMSCHDLLTKVKKNSRFISYEKYIEEYL